MKSSVRYLVVICVLLLSVAALAQTQPKPNPAPAKASPPPVTPAAGAPAQEEQIPPAAPDAIFPAVVARVNGKAILGRDLEQRIQGQLAPIGNPKWANLRDDYRLELTSQALGSLVATELLYQKAASSGIKATEAEVQAEFAKIAKSFPSDAELNANLASRGLDRAALNKDLERSLVVEKFVQEYVAKKIAVTPADATQYYSQHTDEFRHDDIVRSSHIFIQVAQGATPEQDRIARQRAESILARLKKGEDFAKLAKENSMDGSASQGGDLGYLPKGQLTPQFEAVAFSLPVGDYQRRRQNAFRLSHHQGDRQKKRRRVPDRRGSGRSRQLPQAAEDGRGTRKRSSPTCGPRPRSRSPYRSVQDSRNLELHPPVHDDRLTRHVARVVRGEIERHRRDLVHRAEPPHRLPGDEGPSGRLGIGCAGDALPQRRCIDRGRADAVGPDAVLHEIHRKALRYADDPGLRHRINPALRDTSQPGDGRHVDDAAPALPLHHRHRLTAE